MWKFHDFSITQKDFTWNQFWDSLSAKSAILTHLEPLKLQNGSFSNFRLWKIEFTENLRDGKIMIFPNCAVWKNKKFTLNLRNVSWKILSMKFESKFLWFPHCDVSKHSVKILEFSCYSDFYVKSIRATLELPKTCYFHSFIGSEF